MFEKINTDLTNAMKSGDKFELSVLRMLKSALKNEEINKKESLNDDEVMAVIKKQVKVRKDSKTEYESYNRQDLAENLGKEITVLSRYLPEELSDAALTTIVDEVIAQEDAKDIKSMGAVIKAISAKYGASADMSKVSKLVKEKLSSL